MAEKPIRRETVVILGTGPAGLTAGIYAGRASLNPLVLHGSLAGGQLTQTTEIENFPGFQQGLEGNQLIENMQEQAKRFGAKFEYLTVLDIDTSKRPFLLKTSEDPILADSIIIATGASPRKLGFPHEQAAWGKGVHTCSTCDGFFYKNLEVVVVGGGDTMCEDSTFLTKFAKKVYVVHRSKKFRASKIMLERVMSNPKIEIITDTVVDDVIADDSTRKLSGVKIRNILSKEAKTLNVQGLFLAIGHIPNTDFLKGKVELDQDGYIVTRPPSTKTSVTGIFAAGDCVDKIFRQAITAAGTGCASAMETERWLSEEKFHSETSHASNKL